MKKKDVTVGETYLCKVSGKLVTVRIVNESLYGGWEAVNLSTKRSIRIKTAQRLRCSDPDTTVMDLSNGSSATIRFGKRLQTSGQETYDAKQQKLASKLRERKNVTDTAPHLIINARAGTGKTTTLIEGMRLLKEMRPRFEPSPQQTVIWSEMMESRGKARTICFVAFNKGIATELQQRVPESCNAMTMHSMGFAAIRRAERFQDRNGDTQVRFCSHRVQSIISEILGRDIYNLRRYRPELVSATEKLVELCKMNLLRDTFGSEHPGSPGILTGLLNGEKLAAIASYYDIDLNSESKEVFDLVPRVLNRCRDVGRDRCIDYNDMIWLPIVLGLNVYRYDMLLVDEAQDLNRCQQALALKAGRRIILCGDPKQAIYGFAGADSKSMTRMQRKLEATERGCKVLPLTVTRRCGKAIVKEAQKIVPDFEAHESNSEGTVRRQQLKCECKNETDLSLVYSNYVQDGDMILCRTNAPLVSECFKFLRDKRKATILGRDIGQGLVSTVRKLRKGYKPSIPELPALANLDYGVVELLRRLSNWLAAEQRKEQAKRNPNDTRLIALQDRYDCLCAFAEGQETVDDVISSIEAVFTDDKDNPGIRLSSVHKAKGLESKRVFILLPENAGMPHPMAKSVWQFEQEMNLKYVALTRAIEELVYVT